MPGCCGVKRRRCTEDRERRRIVTNPDGIDARYEWWTGYGVPVCRLGKMAECVGSGDEKL